MTFKYPISDATSLGRRDYQEDRLLTSTMEQGTLLAVFDGHGGSEAAEMCDEYFPGLFDDAIGQPSVDSPTAIRIAFADMAKMTNDLASGSTASIAYIPWNKTANPWTIDIVWVAILGDSPVITKSTVGETRVSPEHNVRTNLVERAVAVQRGGTYNGGYLFDYAGRNGMYGQGLQMARAFGDRDLSRVLSREPEMYSVSLGPGSYILVATDGLVDPGHREPEAALKAITELIDGGADAQALVDYAIAVPTYDNATAILARFE